MERVLARVAWVLAGVFLLAACGGQQAFQVRSVPVYADSTILLDSKEYPDFKDIHVYFDDVESPQSHVEAPGLLRVTVPVLPDSAGKASVVLTVKDAVGKELMHQQLAYEPLEIAGMSSSTVFEDTTMTLTGKRLSSKQLSVYFGAQQATILSATNDRLTVKVPTMEGYIGMPVLLQVNRKDRTIFEKRGMVTQDTIRLLDYVKDARWEAGYTPSVLTSDFVSAGMLPFSGPDNDSKGFVRIDNNMRTENDGSYTVLRTHPKWVDLGSIRGLLRPAANGWFPITGKKMFRSLMGYLYMAQTNTDGVTFQVFIHYNVNGNEDVRQLFSTPKKYNGVLLDTQTRLPAVTASGYYVELRVNAGANSLSDWAVWIDPVIYTRKMVF